jgi:hypothetical protein
LALTCLISSGYQLSNIDVSVNTSLVVIYYSSNQLSNLDVSKNTALNRVLCTDNLLTQLNMKNGNNTAIYEASLRGNPNLTCIHLDDETVTTTHHKWDKDNTANYSNDCSVSITETTENFKVALYPNPTTARFMVKTPNSLLGKTMPVYDTFGKLVLQTNLEQTYIVLNLNNISTGVYIVKTTNSQGHNSAQKLVVE